MNFAKKVPAEESRLKTEHGRDYLLPLDNLTSSPRSKPERMREINT